MLRDLLIVVDMLRGFLDEGRPLDCGDAARGIIPFLRDRVAAYHQAGKSIIFLADSHAPDDAEFERFPPHCVAGTEEAQVIPELTEWATPDRMVPKTRYSGFFGTDLEERLRTIDPSTVEVVGVCTNICVLYTVEELRNRDIHTIVPARGVASFDRAAHEFALSQMQTVLGAEVT
jgi:nicotinamidase/pyrazinamidase